MKKKTKRSEEHAAAKAAENLEAIDNDDEDRCVDEVFAYSVANRPIGQNLDRFLEVNARLLADAKQ